MTGAIGYGANWWLHDKLLPLLREQFGTKAMTGRLNEFATQQEKRFFSSPTPFVSEETYRGITAALMVGDASASCGIGSTMILTGAGTFGFPGAMVGAVFSIPLFYNCVDESLHAYRMITSQTPNR
jgi:hypothetical protein